MYLAPHDLLAVQRDACQLVSLMYRLDIVCITYFYYFFFINTSGWVCVQYEAVCTYGCAAGNIWSVMTAGVPTGPDSSLQVRCVSPRPSRGFTQEPDYVNENDQSVAA